MSKQLAIRFTAKQLVQLDDIVKELKRVSPASMRVTRTDAVRHAVAEFARQNHLVQQRRQEGRAE